MNTCAYNNKLIHMLTLNSKYHQHTFLTSHRKLLLCYYIIPIVK